MKGPSPDMSTDNHESTHPNDSKTMADARVGFHARQAAALPFWLARGAPVLTARRASSREWVIDMCPWGGGQHRHGALPGHRIAPCGMNPGYVLADAA